MTKTKKLTAKKLDSLIGTFFNKYGSNVEFNIMDLGKIFAAGRIAYEVHGPGSEDLIDLAVKGACEAFALPTRTTNEKGAPWCES